MSNRNQEHLFGSNQARGGETCWLSPVWDSRLGDSKPGRPGCSSRGLSWIPAPEQRLGGRPGRELEGRHTNERKCTSVIRSITFKETLLLLSVFTYQVLKWNKVFLFLFPIWNWFFYIWAKLTELKRVKSSGFMKTWTFRWSNEQKLHPKRWFPASLPVQAWNRSCTSERVHGSDPARRLAPVVFTPYNKMYQIMKRTNRSLLYMSLGGSVGTDLDK